MVSYHPLSGSFTAATTARVLDTFAAAASPSGSGAGSGPVSERHTVRHRDLHADGYRPGLATSSPASASESPSIDDLRWCEAVVFVYPTWWSGQPATLTGWLQEALAELDADADPTGRSNRRSRPLRNVRRIAAVTTHGSSKLVNSAQGEGGKRVLSRGLRSRCHPLARTAWIALYGIDRSSRTDRQRFLDRIERQLGSW